MLLGSFMGRNGIGCIRIGSFGSSPLWRRLEAISLIASARAAHWALTLSLMIVAAVVSLGFTPDRMFFVVPYPVGKPFAALPLFRTAPELAYIASVMVIAICLVATYANSRAMLARLAPEARVTEFFGLYALSGVKPAVSSLPWASHWRPARQAASNGHGPDRRAPRARSRRPHPRQRPQRQHARLIAIHLSSRTSAALSRCLAGMTKN